MPAGEANRPDLPATPLRALAARITPFLIVAAAGLAVRTPLAAAHPVTALLLFAWIVSDTMMVALLARTPQRRPDRRAVLATLAAAMTTVLIGTPQPLRQLLWASPLALLAMAAVVLIHLGAATMAAWQQWRVGTSDSARWHAAASEFLPPPFVRLVAAELSILHMALLRWGGPADIPTGSRAYAYHRHLAPICAALLTLSLIEAAVYHLLVSHWSRTAAYIMFVFSDVGLIYLVGLIKSFRFRPILIEATGVRVRAGILIDQLIAIDSIVSIETSFDAEAVRDPATLNAALLAWPNVLLRLNTPHPRRSLRRRPPCLTIAFRLDDPEPFVRLMRWRIDQPN